MGIDTSPLDTASMEQLLAQADTERKWLYQRYYDIWFAPEELRQAQLGGRFRWGVINWELRDPQELISQKQKAVDAANKRLQEAAEHVNKWKVGP